MPAACSADKKTEEEERQRREQGREADKAGRRTRKGGRGPPLSSIAKGTFPHTHTMARQPIRVLASLTRPPSYNCSSMAQRSRCEVMQAKEENTGLEIFLSGQRLLLSLAAREQAFQLNKCHFQSQTVFSSDWFWMCCVREEDKEGFYEAWR